MSLGEKIFLYCERGTNEALFAEPLNAVSNLAFFLAALVALLMLMRRPRADRSADQPLLIALVVLIGLGSLAFHLFADRATLFADVVPIDIFMLVYLGFALNRFLRVPPGWTVLLLIGFTGIMFGTGQLKCWGNGIGLPGPEVAGAGPCLNGSLIYIPALAAMTIVGALLYERRHPAAPYILWAALIFSISVAFRVADMALCNEIVFQGRRLGTHFVWHILNGVTLFLLLVASFEAGPGPRAQPIPLPPPDKPEQA
jgi:hypothetical protein